MNKIKAFIEAANRRKHNMIGPVSVVVSADDIIELCKLLEEAEEALETVGVSPTDGEYVVDTWKVEEALFSIKQFKVGAGDTAVQGDMLLPANKD